MSLHILSNEGILTPKEIKEVGNDSRMAAKREAAIREQIQDLKDKANRTSEEENQLRTLHQRADAYHREGLRIGQEFATRDVLGGFEGPNLNALKGKMGMSETAAGLPSSAELKALGEFVLTGKFLATDTPIQVEQSPVSGGAAASIPTIVADSILQNYVSLQPFQKAGARYIETQNGEPFTLPIVSAGPATATYVEGSGPTESTPPVLDSLTFGATSYERLVKVSRVALEDVFFDLQGSIINELLAGLATSFNAATTASLVTALDANTHCTVSQGLHDLYQSLLKLITAIPLRWAAPTNKFMFSRKTLAALFDLRDNQNRPILDLSQSQVLGYQFVLNDSLVDRILFGDFSGVFIRRTPLYLQRLNELYAQTGHIGFKIVQRLDSKFLASLTSNSIQPVMILSGTYFDPYGS